MERNIDSGSIGLSLTKCQRNHNGDSDALVMKSMEIDEDADRGPISKERIMNMKPSTGDVTVLEVLTVRGDWPAELCASGISLDEVEKEIKNGAKAYICFTRDC